MNKRITARVIAGSIAAALLGLGAYALPAQADSAWGGRVATKDSSSTRIIGAPAFGGAEYTRIIG